MRVLTTNTLMLAASLIVNADRPMRCYQCNSAKDPKCDSSDVSNLRQYIKLCPLLKDGTYAGNEPTACRKIVQNVEELPVQIIRECAYTGSKHLDGMRKQGNKAIKLFYYQCENVDGDIPCNGSQQIMTQYFALTLLLITVIAAAVTKYRW